MLEGGPLVGRKRSQGGIDPGGRFGCRGGILPPAIRRCLLAPAARNLGLSWTAQPFPSGSLKNMNEFQSSPFPSTKPLPSWCWIGLTGTPRALSSTCAASMSATDSWRPLSEPGSISARPVPIVTEQPEPGGVIWTTRKCSLGA